MAKKQKTANAVDILYRMICDKDPVYASRYPERRRFVILGSEINRLRTEAKLSKKTLAEMVGTSPSTITRIEWADYVKPPKKVLEEIAGVFHKRLSDSFVLEDELVMA